VMYHMITNYGLLAPCGCGDMPRCLGDLKTMALAQQVLLPVAASNHDKIFKEIVPCSAEIKNIPLQMG
jgi:hypothetical protein